MKNAIFLTIFFSEDWDKKKCIKFLLILKLTEFQPNFETEMLYGT